MIAVVHLGSLTNLIKYKSLLRFLCILRCWSIFVNLILFRIVHSRRDCDSISVKLLPLCIFESVHGKERAEGFGKTVSRRCVQLLLGHCVVIATKETNIILLIVIVLGGCFKSNGYSRRSQIQPFSAALGTTRYLHSFTFILLLRLS